VGSPRDLGARHEKISKHNQKKKQKQTNKKNQVKTYAKKIHDYKMTITNNKKDLG
jgi:uncharacterized protein YlxW (UPF0749 family)